MAAGNLSFSLYGKENETLKLLGQANPDVNSATDLYTVPASSQTLISSIAVTNIGTTAYYYRISISSNGAATDPKDYIAYGHKIEANSTTTFTLGLTIDSSDIVRVYSYPGEPVTGSLAWYDAADGSTVTHSSGAVSQWNDKSGNGYNVTQATAANQPSYTSAIGGKSVLTFDAAGPEYLSNTAIADTAQPFTAFVVTRNDDTAVVKWILTGSTTTANRALIRTNASEIQAIDMGTVLSGGTMSTTLLGVSTSVINSTTSQLFLNGSSQGSGDAGANNLQDIRIGANHAAANGWSGDIAEIIIYNSVLSTANRELVEAYLKNKWDTP